MTTTDFRTRSEMRADMRERLKEAEKIMADIRNRGSMINTELGGRVIPISFVAKANTIIVKIKSLSNGLK